MLNYIKGTLNNNDPKSYIKTNPQASGGCLPDLDSAATFDDRYTMANETQLDISVAQIEKENGLVDVLGNPTFITRRYDFSGYAPRAQVTVQK